MSFLLVSFLSVLSLVSFSQEINPNFNFSTVSSSLEDARQMTYGKGKLYVGSSGSGKVYELGLKTGKKRILLQDRVLPTGVSYIKNDLFIASRTKVEKMNLATGKLETVVSGLYESSWHGRRVLEYDEKNNFLYLSVGTPCNVCVPKKGTGEIRKVDLKTFKEIVVAKGVRNSVGMAINPKTGRLWFTDNGRDMMGDDLPDEELNEVSNEGEHFGFPYIHAHSIKDPDYFQKLPGNLQLKGPRMSFQAHMAPLGMDFYKYKGKLGVVIAFHGSWNRSSKVGYKVSFYDLETKKETILINFLEGKKVLGRPADILVLGKDIYVSDDYTDSIYKLNPKLN